MCGCIGLIGGIILIVASGGSWPSLAATLVLTLAGFAISGALDC